MEVRIIGQMDNTIDHTFESANRVYDKNGLCPTIPTCAGGNIQPKILEGEENMSERQNGIKAKKLPNGNIRFYQDDEKKSAISELQVQSGADVAQTITTANVPKIYEEKQIVAMRGRGEHNEQRLEPNTQGVVNALTTVQKDNLVMEKKINKVGQLSNEGSQCGTVVSDEGLSPTLSAGTHGYCTKYRIRKLTEKECFRLMGFKDSDFEKARAVNSATQIYKQAGNSIVKQVLMAIFLQMNIQGLKPWNDRNEDEIRELIK